MERKLPKVYWELCLSLSWWRKIERNVLNSFFLEQIWKKEGTHAIGTVLHKATPMCYIKFIPLKIFYKPRA